MRLFEGHKAGICCLTFSPDGKYLASGGEDFSIKVWDLRASRILANLSGHRGKVNDLCFNEDSSMIMSASEDKTIKFWNIKSIQRWDQILISLSLAPVSSHSGSSFFP